MYRGHEVEPLLVEKGLVLYTFFSEIGHEFKKKLFCLLIFHDVESAV